MGTTRFRPCISKEEAQSTSLSKAAIMSDITQEEIVEIVTNFLLNSPPGEFMEVVTDVRGLLPDESILNDSAPATFREYNTDQMLQMQSPGNPHKFLITNEHYQNGTATIYGKKEGGSVVVTICISSARFNPNNFWNGRWRAVWTCKFSPSGGNVDISGVLKVNVHYYEDGNVQLSATGSDARGLADAVVKAIDKAESNFHKSLE